MNCVLLTEVAVVAAAAVAVHLPLDQTVSCHQEYGFVFVVELLAADVVVVASSYYQFLVVANFVDRLMQFQLPLDVNTYLVEPCQPE